MLIFYIFPRKNEEPLTRFVNDNPNQHVKKQRHYFAYKGPYSQNYGFSSSHI